MNWVERYAMSRPRTVRSNPPVIRAQCGSRYGLSLHAKNDENSCELCLEATRNYANDRNRSLGVPEFQPAQCGTNGGYMKHLHDGESACTECLRAHNEHVQWYNLPSEIRDRALTTVREGES